MQEKLPKMLRIIWYLFVLCPNQAIPHEIISPKKRLNEPRQNCFSRSYQAINRLKEALPGVEIVRVKQIGYTYIPGHVPNPK